MLITVPRDSCRWRTVYYQAPVVCLAETTSPASADMKHENDQFKPSQWECMPPINEVEHGVFSALPATFLYTNIGLPFQIVKCNLHTPFVFYIVFFKEMLYSLPGI